MDQNDNQVHIVNIRLKTPDSLIEQISIIVCSEIKKNTQGTILQSPSIYFQHMILHVAQLDQIKTC